MRARGGRSGTARTRMKMGELSHVRLLFQTAVEQSERSGLPKILEKLAEVTDSCGCILWQVAREAGTAGQGGTPGRLFVLADWFPDERGYPRLHDIPLRDDSATGRAILSRCVVTVAQVRAGDDGPDPFLSETAVKSACAVPIEFHDGAVGAVSLYRTSARPFSAEEVLWVEQLAQMVPGFYQAHRDRVSLTLLAQINDILHEAESQASGSVLPKGLVCDYVRRICAHVGDSFNCVEASVFLEDSLENPGVYELVATTHPESFERLAYERDSTGLTGWVLRYAKPVKIFDLASFERDREDIQQRYPNLEWHYLGHTLALARETFDLGLGREMPPLSFIAAPVTMGGKVHGVIRCCIARRGPYYFAERELGLLKLVAAQLSRYWGNWLGRRAEASRYRSDMERQQAQTFQDLSHQLITPITQAHMRAQALIDSPACDADMRDKVYAIRGLCGKAEKVVMNTRLFADLAAGRAGRANLETVAASQLTKMLTEAAQDSQIMVNPHRSLKFHLDCNGFDSASREFTLDLGLVTQAVNNLLDNASKYSFDGSDIRISAGMRRGRFYISVTNRGIGITPNEVKEAVKRGWRGEHASWVTGEGSGIGLWVVENVMHAHGGELLIIPTTPDGLTDIRLLFPNASKR
jgi:signal transduction histidine kinase